MAEGADATRRETRLHVSFPRIGYPTSFTELSHLALHFVSACLPPNLISLLQLTFTDLCRNALSIVHPQSAHSDTHSCARDLCHAPRAHTRTSSFVSLDSFATVELHNSSISQGWVLVAYT